MASSPGRRLEHPMANRRQPTVGSWCLVDREFSGMEIHQYDRDRLTRQPLGRGGPEVVDIDSVELSPERDAARDAFRGGEGVSI